MVLNYIWIAFFLVAFAIAVVKLVFMGDTTVFPAMMNSTFDSAKTAFEISLGLTGVLSLWLGVMKIGERGGVVNMLARVLSPVFTRLFPDIPKGHPVTGSIFMNMAANMLVSFVCAMQVQTFRKVRGHAYASTMCIGNLRSGTEALCEYFHDKNPAVLRRALTYFGVIGIFALGAGAGAWITARAGERTIWISCALLTVSFLLMFLREKRAEEKELL